MDAVLVLALFGFLLMLALLFVMGLLVRNVLLKPLRARRIHARRVARPDWVFYERHLERPVPGALRTFFEGHSNPARPMRIDDTMVSFVSAPIDEQALTETRKWYGLEVVPFMSGGDADNLGDILFLLPGASQPDTVHIVYGEKSEIVVEEFDSSLEVFVKRFRT